MSDSSKNSSSGIGFFGLMKTDTPRTDAAVKAAPEYATPEYVHSDFARQLERELKAEKAKTKRLTETLNEYEDQWIEDNV